jgi:hypothetical protein
VKLYSVSFDNGSSEMWFETKGEAQAALKDILIDQPDGPVRLTMYVTNLKGRELALALLRGSGWAEEITELDARNTLPDATT